MEMERDYGLLNGFYLKMGKWYGFYQVSTKGVKWYDFNGNIGNYVEYVK